MPNGCRVPLVHIDRELILKALRTAGAGLRADELVKAVNADAKGKHRIRAVLSDLIDENVVEKAPAGRYRLVGYQPPEPIKPPGKGGGNGETKLNKGEVAGRIRVHPAAYGFVAREDGEDDVFIPAKYRGNALDGDRVAITTWMGYKGTEGRVERVIERGRAKLTGILRGRGAHAHLEPDDPRIVATSGHVVLPEGTGGARDGQAVVVEITKYPTRAEEPLEGRLFRVLGD